MYSTVRPTEPIEGITMTNLNIIEQHDENWKRTTREIRDEAAFVTFKWLGNNILTREGIDNAPAVIKKHIKRGSLAVDGHNYSPMFIDIRTDRGREDLISLINWMDTYLINNRNTIGEIKHWRDTENAVFVDYTIDEARAVANRDNLWDSLDARTQMDSL